MTRLVTWINQSTDYNGTEIFRDTTLDPEALPAPVATVGPVAQGARAEWKDRGGNGDQCYLVRDFDDQGVGEVSEAYCYDEPDPFEDVQVGDPIGGGFYAGKFTYGDGRQFHIIVADVSACVDGYAWKTSNTATSGTGDHDDGAANTSAMLAAGTADHPAADFCASHDGGGNSDWYLASRNENQFCRDQLWQSVTSATNFQAGGEQAYPDEYYLTSTEASASAAYQLRYTNSFEEQRDKTFDFRFVRPIRRVAA